VPFAGASALILGRAGAGTTGSDREDAVGATASGGVLTGFETGWEREG